MPTPRATLGQLTRLIESRLGSNLLGLYLFGSLATGGFYPGKSDLDLIAIVKAEIEGGDQLEALRRLHDAFVSERPTWVERIEVAYVSREVLQTFSDRPSGTIAVISPGEPCTFGTSASNRRSTGTARATTARGCSARRRSSSGRQSPTGRADAPSRSYSANGEVESASRRSRTSPPRRDTSSSRSAARSTPSRRESRRRRRRRPPGRPPRFPSGRRSWTSRWSGTARTSTRLTTR